MSKSNTLNREPNGDATLTTKERLQKVLASYGIASRRACEEMIRARRVQVNGRIVTEQGVKVDPGVDDIRVDDVPLPKKKPLTYILLNKPVGVFSTASDEKGRRTVVDLVPPTVRVYPVGRLDADSEGLILLTNDGELTNHLTHPRYGHKREYRVLVIGRPEEELLQKIRRGMILEEGPTGPAVAEIVGPKGCERDRLPTPERGTTWLKIVIGEGRKHQVRRMCEIIGHPVLRLIRVGMGPLRLGDLPVGQYRYLTPEEIAALRALVSGSGRPTKVGRSQTVHRAALPASRHPQVGRSNSVPRPAGRDRTGTRRKK